MLSFPMSEVLKRIAGERGYLGLEKEIMECNEGKRLIRRRKLKKIAEYVPGQSKDFPLCVKEIEALHNYLASQGHGLEPMVHTEGLMDLLAGQQRITFFLGIRPVSQRPGERRGHVSIWDVRAIGHILREINQRRHAVRFDVVDIPLAHDQPLSKEELSQYLPKDNSLVCSIGLPLSSQMTEYMLAEMFGVEPFQPPGRGEELLPFYWVWYPPSAEGDQPRNSHFALTCEDLDRSTWRLKDGFLADDVKKQKAKAVVIGKEVHPVRFVDPKEWNDYGVVVAQRRPTGHVWIVVAGLTGPATSEAARLLANVANKIPPKNDSHEPQLAYHVVKCTLNRDPNIKAGDDRRIISSILWRKPHLWPDNQ